MNWENSGLIAVIIILVLVTTSEARGGRGGGWGRGSRSSGGGGGWLSGLLGGSSSRKKISSSLSPSSSSLSVPHSNGVASYNSMHHRTSNNGSSFDSVLSKNSGLSDFLNGYMVGNLFSRDSFYRRPEEYPKIYPTMYSSAERAGNSQSRLLVINNNNHQEETVNKNDPFGILNEFNKPFDENESMSSFLERILKVDFKRVMHETSAKIAELNRRTDEKSKTVGEPVEENQTMKETIIKEGDTSISTELPSSPAVEFSPGTVVETTPPNVESSTVTPSVEFQVVVAESSLESRPAVSPLPTM